VADLHPLSAYLDLDCFFAKLRTGAIEPWRTKAHQQNRVVLSAAAAALTAFAAGEYFTIGEGILYPNMVDLFSATCEPLGLDLNYAVREAPLDVVHRRVEGRTTDPEHAGALADAAVIDDLWALFEGLGVEERHRVDSGRQAPRTVAEEIDRRLQSGDFLL
jgi:hypothetical protein